MIVLENGKKIKETLVSNFNYAKTRKFIIWAAFGYFVAILTPLNGPKKVYQGL
jgi:hypothetical protein